MGPLRSFFTHHSRHSMKPLIIKDEKGIYQSATSPISRPSSPPWQTSFVARKHKALMLLIGIFLLFLFSSFAAHTTLKTMIEKTKTEFDIVATATTEPYVSGLNWQQQFSWSNEAFLPPKKTMSDHLSETYKTYTGKEVPESVPIQHSLSLYPKKIDLSGLNDTVNPEEIVFGFTSPYLRAREMCGTWTHFLKHRSQCLIVLPKHEELFVQDMHYYLAREGLGHCKVTTVDLGKYDRYEHRVMNMPRSMREQEWTDRDGNKVVPKWYVVVDDDSQVLDMRALQREMSRRRHEEDHILCGVTESQVQLGRHGRICFGGAGIAISDGLASKMARRMGECLWHHSWQFGGDEMLTHCASLAASTPELHKPPHTVFEEVEGLHQIDIPGDATGVFQSGLPFITIHHYLGWLELFPRWSTPKKMEGLRRLQRSADLVGGDNLFKRFVFDDGSTVLTLGYSITLLSQPLKKYEMQLMERTYRHWEHPLHWPSRPSIPEGQTKAGRYKITYYIVDVLNDGTMVYQNARNDTIRIRIDNDY